MVALVLCGGGWWVKGFVGVCKFPTARACLFIFQFSSFIFHLSAQIIYELFDQIDSYQNVIPLSRHSKRRASFLSKYSVLAYLKGGFLHPSTKRNISIHVYTNKQGRFRLDVS